jgi:molecular chaperone DnaK (HSP70)
MNRFKKQHNINKLVNLSSLSLQKLKRSCENAKKMLSLNDKALIAVKDFYNNTNLHLRITKKQFETICRDLFILALKPIDDILKTLELGVEEVDEIILVGGATRMPLIQDNIRTFFRGKSPDCSVNPDEVVAVGAGIQATILSSKTNPFSESVVLLDVIPLSLGVETIGGVMNVLIPRNSTIPIKRKKKYTTDDDYQDEVTIKIFEGERKMTKDNFFVGQFDLTGIEKAPRGVAEIEITFEVDINGIINVLAIDSKNTDNKKKITVSGNKGRLTKEKIAELIKESEEMEIKDRLEREKKHYYYEIDDLCSNVLVNIQNDEFKLKKHNIEHIQNDIKKTIEWLKRDPYYAKDKKDYIKIIKVLKKKYGTLILKITHNSNNVKGQNTKGSVGMTSVFDNEDDDDENDKIYEKIENDDMGLYNEPEEEKEQLKTMRTYLIDLCNSTFDIITASNISITTGEKHILKDLVDDILLWVHVKDKITRGDYQEKIDLIDKNCNEIFDKYNDNLFSSNDKNSREELEQLCYAIASSINNNILNMQQEEEQVLKTMVEDTLDWLIDVEVQQKKALIEGTEYNVDDKVYNDKINIINEYCNNIYNSMVNTNVEPTIDIDESNEDDNMSGTSLAELMRNQ